MNGDVTFEVSLTWAVVTCFIGLLIFIYSLKKGDKE